MYISQKVLSATSIDSVVELISEAPISEGIQGIEFSAEQLAGAYAFDSAKSADDGMDPDEIAAHLDFLSEAGAEFDTNAALQHAVEYAENDE